METYICDPNKAIDCIKTDCHLNGGDCYATTHREYAKDPTTLEDTIKGMTSEDYKERFKAEYQQLVIRIEGLTTFTKKINNGLIPQSILKYPIEILEIQLKYMLEYRNMLIYRATYDGINID